MQPSLTTNYSFLAATTSQSKNNLSKASDSAKASKSTSFFSASKLNDKEKYNQTTTNNPTNKNNPNNEKFTHKQQNTLPNAEKPDPASAKKNGDSVKKSENDSGTLFKKLKSWMGYESKVNYFRRDGASMSLPEEMIFSILQLLNFKDLAVLAMVDKNCNDLVKSFLGFELGWFQMQEYTDEIIAYFRKLPADKIFDGDVCKERVLWRSYMSEYVLEFLDFSVLDLQYDTSVFTQEVILPTFILTLYNPYRLHGVRLINEKTFLSWVNININSSIRVGTRMIDLGKDFKQLKGFIKDGRHKRIGRPSPKTLHYAGYENVLAAYTDWDKPGSNTLWLEYCYNSINKYGLPEFRYGNNLYKATLHQQIKAWSENKQIFAEQHGNIQKLIRKAQQHQLLSD
jgi:hypothetical protein